MVRGRPARSEIRERITALLSKLKVSYGYEIYKNYKQVFDGVTSRVIYYHLRKGIETGEFIVVNVERALGNYTWGDECERIYYTIGPFARTKQVWWDQASKITVAPREINFDWEKEVRKNIELLKISVQTNKGKDKQKLLNKCDKLIGWINNRENNETLISEINSIKLFLK
ncbi:MAG: hypothetical protein WC307_01845 [Candidatus Nanoarchaeia archaeon]|jgi:hypothetical protein